MDAATAGILANIRAVTGVVPAAAPAAPASGLQALVAQALREGQSDSYIDALVNEAAGRGEFSVPKALVTNDGRVDTATILASIVSQARSCRMWEGEVQLNTGECSICAHALVYGTNVDG